MKCSFRNYFKKHASCSRLKCLYQIVLTRQAKAVIHPPPPNPIQPKSNPKLNPLNPPLPLPPPHPPPPQRAFVLVPRSHSRDTSGLFNPTWWIPRCVSSYTFGGVLSHLPSRKGQWLLTFFTTTAAAHGLRQSAGFRMSVVTSATLFGSLFWFHKYGRTGSDVPSKDSAFYGPLLTSQVLW